MASNPVRRAQEAYLTQHEIAVFEHRANGFSWRQVAAHFLTSCHVLNTWLKADPDRLAAWKSLDEIAAESRASDAREILDDAFDQARYGVSSPEITRLAISRSELAKWEAGVMARGRFGDTKAAMNVNVNVGGMHLTAVREINVNPPPPPPGLLHPAPVEVDYEIVEDDDAAMERLLHG